MYQLGTSPQSRKIELPKYAPEAPSSLTEQYHSLSERDLRGWNWDPSKLQALFTNTEFAQLLERMQINPAVRKIAFLSWENPWAKAGGIFPVADMLPAELKKAGESTVTISPLHTGLSTSPLLVRDAKSGEGVFVEGRGVYQDVVREMMAFQSEALFKNARVLQYIKAEAISLTSSDAERETLDCLLEDSTRLHAELSQEPEHRTFSFLGKISWNEIVRFAREDQESLKHIEVVVKTLAEELQDLFRESSSLTALLGVQSFDEDVLSQHEGLHKVVLTRVQEKGGYAEFHLIREVVVPFNESYVPCQVYRATLPDGKEWVLFRAPTFFVADGGRTTRDPYSYTTSGGHDMSQPGLVRDSLFAAAAVPRVLCALQMEQDVVCQYHDWQFSGVALTVPEALLDGTLVSAATVATLHNSYDEYLPDYLLATITQRASNFRWPGWGDKPRDTFFSRFLPLSTGPSTTVSVPFKLDLTLDPQQNGYFAPHLQSLFRDHGVVGIGHGPFLDPAMLRFSKEALASARERDLLPIFREKMMMYLDFVSQLSKFPKDVVGTLNMSSLPHVNRDLIDFSHYPNIPIFVMGGRLDPHQKGFDLLAHTIRMLPEGSAKFVLSPVLSDQRYQNHLEFLMKVAEERPGDVLVLPKGLPRDQYTALLSGVTAALFPSMREPYGAVSEPNVMGTPVIARAAGGLQNQVVDFFEDPKRATGFTFREEEPPHRAELTRDWLEILNQDDPERRIEVPLYHDICEAFARQIMIACEMFTRDPQSYAHMLANVGFYVQELSWERPVRLYRELFDISGSSARSLAVGAGSGNPGFGPA